MSLRVVKARESAGGLDQAFSRIRVTGGESDAREPLLKIISHAYDVRSWSSARHAGNWIDQYDFDKTGRPTSCPGVEPKTPHSFNHPFPGCAHVSREELCLIVYNTKTLCPKKTADAVIGAAFRAES